MHIAFLTPEYPHPESTPSGGLGTSIKNLAASLVTQNLEVTVFVYGQQHDLDLKENGVSLHFIKKKKYTFLGWYLYRKHLQGYINTHIEKGSIDILEAPDWTGITSLIKISCPVIIRMNGSDGYFCELDGRSQKRKHRFFEHKALKSADALVSVSAFTASKTKELFDLVQPIDVIPNGIDINKFKPLGKAVVQNQLLYFGAIIRKKGVLELAEIFNIIALQKPQAELLLIGRDVEDIFEKSSTLELFYKKLTFKAKQQIRYIPEVGYSEIKEYIAQAAVIILPSFAEALPMTWLEAMAMEKALVTSNIGWANEVMVDGTTGFTEDPKEHKKYAQKILHLMDHPEVSGTMGKAAREQVLTKFSTGVVVHQNLEFYKRHCKSTMTR